VTLQAITDPKPVAASDGKTPHFFTTLSLLLTEATASLEKDHAAHDYLARARQLLSRNLIIVQNTTQHQGKQLLAPWQVNRVKQYIEENLETTIKTEELVTLTRLSASYFFRAFKGSFGVPPHAYIVMRRIDRAQRLLVTTNEPLCQIALSVGLNDQAHLSRLFRQQTGRTPGSWRRENRGERPVLPETQIAS